MRYAAVAMLLRLLLVALFALALIAQSAVGGVVPVFAGAHHCAHTMASDSDHSTTKCPCCGDRSGALDCGQVCAPAFVAAVALAIGAARIRLIPSSGAIAAQGRTTLPSIRPPIA